jgi:hypothetical protein
MKKITKLLLLVAIFISAGSTFSSIRATDYCNFEVHSTRPDFQTAHITYKSLGSNQYEFKFEAVNEILSWNEAGSNFFAEVNGVGGTQVSANLVKSSDNKTLTWTVTSTPKPNIYVCAFFVNFADGEHRFDLPTDEDFNAVCGTTEEDSEAPTLFTATKGTVTENSVELLLNATDNSGAITYNITYGSTNLTTTGTSATQKSYVVNGLTASTAYSFSVTAKDAANNTAANNPIVVNATTSAATVLSTIDFETVGQDWNWTIFENVDNSASLYAVVANPSATGVNTSANVAKYTVNAGAQPWAGLWSANLPDFTFTEDNCIIKVMVYKDVISNFLVKFENDNASVAFEKQVPNTVTNQWEELTFDFTNKIGTSVTKLVIIPDFPSTRTAGSTNYWDNVSFGGGEEPVVVTDPTVAAPTPTTAAEKVISLFSNAYTNATVDTWRTGWSNASFENVNIASNATIKYSDLVFVGAETVANMIDASGMTHLHLDIWTPDVTTFKVKLVDFGANAAWAGGDDTEHELTFSPTLSAWNSLNIPLSDFIGLTSKAHMAQYIFSGAPSGKVFIDNIYFYNGTPTLAINASEESKLQLYPNPVKDNLNINASAGMKLIEVRNLVGQLVKNISVSETQMSVDMSDLNSGNYIVSIQLENGKIATQKIVKL